MQKDKKILHIDMDAFFASVEQRDNPTLKGKPIAIGGNPNKRGVVATASYEARKYGVRSAMPAKTALKLCPQLIFVPSNFQKYLEISNGIRKIFRQVTDLVEPLSIDEAYLDVTNNKTDHQSVRNLANWIKQEIYNQFELTSSAGASNSKLLAKMASDYNKPNGLTIIPPHQVLQFLAPLPIERLWGVGPATAKKLHQLNLYTIGQLRHKTPEELQRQIGKMGPELWKMSFGKDDREVCPVHIQKNKGVEETFSKDISDLDFLKEVLKKQVEKIYQRLIDEKKICSGIIIKIRTLEFKTKTRSHTFTHPTNSLNQLRDSALHLFNQFYENEVFKPVRLIGFTVRGLEKKNKKSIEQLSLNLF